MATPLRDAEGVTEEQFYEKRCAELESILEAKNSDIKERFVLIHTFAIKTNHPIYPVFVD